MALRRFGADHSARHVAFRCFDGHFTSIDVRSALQPQSNLALDFEEKPLASQWGASGRRRIPAKLGFRSPKNLEALGTTDKHPDGHFGNQRHDWFADV